MRMQEYSAYRNKVSNIVLYTFTKASLHCTDEISDLDSL